MSEDVIETLLKGLDEKCETRFNGIDARLDTANGHVASLTVRASEVKRRHEIEDDRAEVDTDRNKQTRSTIRFWVLIVGVPLAGTQVALQVWERLS